MKFAHFLIITGISISSIAQNKAIISVNNLSLSERKQVVIAVKWENILAKFPSIDTLNFVVLNSVSKKQIPYQLEHKGQNSIQNLLLQVDVKAKSSVLLSIQKGKPAIFETKTYGRFVPERKDDFAWENNIIAHRVYGKALELDPKQHAAYGIDVWVKRSNKMVINERYKRATAPGANANEYHMDRGNGMDYYAVDATLGAGNMMPYVNDTIFYSKYYRTYKILDNGPLRTSFQLTFDSWYVGKTKVNVTKTISIDANSQLSRMENVYTFNDSKPLPVVIGIRRRAEPGVISLNEQEGIMGYWEPTFPEDGTTGVGVVLVNSKNEMLVSKTAKEYTQLLAKIEVKNNEPVVYYSGAAWDRAGKITNSKQWFDYLNTFTQNLNKPLLITIK